MASAHATLPTRSATTSTTDDDYAVPDEDTSEVTKLFLERIQAWKHACGYLQDYIVATEKSQSNHVKEYEKVLKTVNSPLKQGHHFDQSLGGICGMFENIRSNTQGLAHSHTKTAKAIKGTVVPILERLHSELKNKNKEISKGAGKGSKAVDKARNASQKHIELLGQHTAAFDSAAGKVSAHEDPYVLQRGIYHRLNKQVAEENNNRQDLLLVQSSFAQFETHVVQAFQSGMVQFDQIMSRQAEQTRTLYGDMASTTQRVKPDFEWRGFLSRNNQVLIDPSVPERSVDNLGFANQDHRSTQPIIAGSLERKSKVLKKYEAGYYAVTPSKFLHELKTNDNFAKDPVPENSLYLPDCIVGALDGTRFAVKGKDASKGAIGSKLSLSHEYQFQAHTPADAQKWWEVIRSVAGQTSSEMPEAALDEGHALQAGARAHPGSTLTGVPAGQPVGATPVPATNADKVAEQELFRI